MSIGSLMNVGVNGVQYNNYANNVTAPQNQNNDIEQQLLQQQNTEQSVEQHVEKAVQQEPGVRTQVVGEFQSAKSAAQVDESKKAETTQQAAQSGEAAEGQETEQSNSLSRTLRLALADNTKQLQGAFSKANTGATNSAQAQHAQLNAQAKRTVMLRNLESMVNTQLAQYTGDEPYTRGNYRQILGALGQMQNTGSTSKTQDVKDNTAANAWVNGEEHEENQGVYKLYSGQAAKTLSFLNSSPQSLLSDDYNYVA